MTASRLFFTLTECGALTTRVEIAVSADGCTVEHAV